MRFKININSADTVEEVPGYWSMEDYKKLLEKLNYPDSEKVDQQTLADLLLMAITDFEPVEAAAIILEYKLGDKLNERQIHQISNNMLVDKISEEYPDISLHPTLFHINQLLYKAFNGKFPNTKATIVNFSVSPLESSKDVELTKEQVLNLLEKGLSGSNLIKRLFGDQMTGLRPFTEAEHILWELKSEGNNTFEILTSHYWLSKDDFVEFEFEGVFEQTKDPIVLG